MCLCTVILIHCVYIHYDILHLMPHRQVWLRLPQLEREKKSYPPRTVHLLSCDLVTPQLANQMTLTNLGYESEDR